MPPPRNIPIRKLPPPKRNPTPELLPLCSAKPPKQATGRTHIVDLKDGVKLEMVEIPAGSFCMGSTEGRASQQPVHRVTIGREFYLGRYEVTQAQWQALMGSNPSSFKNCGGDCPVENVSWDSAQNFINKLNGLGDGFKYRFPTESEWEYACRAGNTGDYAGELKDTAWYSENSGQRTHPAGQKLTNAWGLADMRGNVWEWCADWYHETYNGAPTDGGAWLSGGKQVARVLRGGSWGNPATILRAGRYFTAPDYGGPDFGFRVVAVR